MSTQDCDRSQSEEIGAEPTPYTFKTAEESNEFKDQLCVEASVFLHSKMKHLEGKTHWLMRSRVLNVLFQQHYGLSVRAAENLANQQALKQAEEM